MVGATVGGVRWLLRLEGVCICIASVLAYAKYGASWGVFFAWFLFPDVSLLGYLAGPRPGAIAYNVAHSYVGPLICIVVALSVGDRLFLNVSLIWCAHIGFDRSIGYGLKYAQGFARTHLGPIGRATLEVATPLVDSQD